MAKQKLGSDEDIKGTCGSCVGDFWSWAYSDILNNRNRSIFAEFVVGLALGTIKNPRIEWDCIDHKYGKKAIEVKSAAYIQSWNQSKLSNIVYDIAKKVPWYADSNTYGTEAKRSADCYVFCLYTQTDKTRVDVLDLSDWQFYVLSTEKINQEFGEQKSVSLNRLAKACNSVTYDELKGAVDACLANTKLNGRDSA